MLNFIEPNHFSSMEDFQAQFGDLNNIEQLERLKTKLEPYLLR